MKKALFLLIPFTFIGCHSRLLGSQSQDKQPDPQTFTSAFPTAGSCPEIQAPTGFSSTHIYGILHNSYNVPINNDSTSTLFVLLRDAGTWFKLGTSVSGAYWYQRSPVAVTYQGPYLEGKEYCIYEFVPQP